MVSSSQASKEAGERLEGGITDHIVMTASLSFALLHHWKLGQKMRIGGFWFGEQV